MTSDVVLCADTESLKEPGLIGLEGENLCSQPWIRAFADACQARYYLQQSRNRHEVWVASSDNVDPINLAAALKQDSAENKVYLLAFQGSGSLQSRANAAGIDGMFDRCSFAKHYGSRKRASLLQPTRSRKADAFINEGWSFSERKRTEEKAVSDNRAKEQLVGNCLKKNSTASELTVKGLDSEFLRNLDLGQRSLSEKEREKTALVGVSDSREETSALPNSLPHKKEIPDAVAQQATSSQVRIARGKQAFVLVVASASGGAGKSTVSAIAATCAQKLGHKTLLIDADLQFGDEQFLLGAENPLTIDEALRDLVRLQNLKPEAGMPALVAAPRHLEQSESVSAEMPRLIDAAKSVFDVVVVNTGAFWAEQHALLLEQATRVLFLVDQRPSSMRACNHALELCARCGIATQSFLFAVNRCARNSLFSSIDVSCGLRGAHVVELKEGGREVDELLGAGMPLALMQAENALCVSLESLLLDLFPAGNACSSDVFSEGGKIDRRHGRLSKWKRKVACLC
ncbi:MAG: chromosome partitioning protein ParA [Raoultibacter sp.]